MDSTEPAEQKAMIRPLKCCGGFRMLHAIQPRTPPTMNVIAILTGINHLKKRRRTLGPLNNHRGAEVQTCSCCVFSIFFFKALKEAAMLLTTK